MKKILSIALILMLALSATTVLADDDKDKKQAKAAEKRQKLDEIASQALDRLMKNSDQASELFGRAFGYAVFDNTKVAFGITGGGGAGVAVEKGSGSRTYMKMGTAGIGLGIGAQVYQVVFLFETEAAFRQFVDRGWEAETQANAAAGTKGANAEATFSKGMAIYQLTEAGLLASADIAGTKYWKNKKLN